MVCMYFWDLGSRISDEVSSNLGPGLWILETVSRVPDPGSKPWIRDPGYCILDRGCWQDPGCWISDPGFWVLHPALWTLNPGPRLLEPCPGSWILYPGSCPFRCLCVFCREPSLSFNFGLFATIRVIRIDLQLCARICVDHLQLQSRCINV